MQSVVTLDPRGIVHSKLQALIDARTPDVVLEASERLWRGPDIFSREMRKERGITGDSVPSTRALPVEISIIEEDSKLLSQYQIELLRKKSEKGGGSNRKTFERKLTAELESVASNDTRITDCDERRRKEEVNHNLMRSHSLGHEQTEAKPTRTFKKYSLPTPQLKDVNSEKETAKRKTVSEVKVSTLTRHYYPEGGWGFVIVTCSVLVQILCHGLQLSSGPIMVKSAGKFNVDIVHTGKSPHTMNTISHSCHVRSFD